MTGVIDMLENTSQLRIASFSFACIRAEIPRCLDFLVCKYLYVSIHKLTSEWVEKP